MQTSDRTGLSVAGVVLAAGGGLRYGMPKILAEQGDWLSHAVDALAHGGCRPVLVTVGAAWPPMPADALAVAVDRWRSGLSESVRAGLDAAESYDDVAGVVLHVIDIPDVGATAVRRVLAYADADPSALVRAAYGDTPGHPVYIGREHWAAVRRSLGGDRGAGRYLDSNPKVVTVECGDLASGRDRDTR